MPKYQFVQWEEIKSIITFDADDLEHAKELVMDTMDWNELSNAEIFSKSGSTDWEDVEELNA